MAVKVDQKQEYGKLDFRIREFQGQKIVEGFVRYHGEVIEIEQFGCAIECSVGSITSILLKAPVP